MKKNELLNTCKSMNLRMSDKIIINGIEGKLSGYVMDNTKGECFLLLSVRRKSTRFDAKDIHELICLEDTSKRRVNNWDSMKEFEEEEEEKFIVIYYNYMEDSNSTEIMTAEDINFLRECITDDNIFTIMEDIPANRVLYMNQQYQGC